MGNTQQLEELMSRYLSGVGGTVAPNDTINSLSQPTAYRSETSNDSRDYRQSTQNSVISCKI